MPRKFASRSKQTGFTLVEIAIVLVIIGLLLGGVLKGQELITQAKIKTLTADLNGISTAVYAYQDRFKALPGDDKNAPTRWTTLSTTPTAATLGDTKLDGKFNSKTATDESHAFWEELRLAGLITGETTSGQPQNAVGGITGVQWGAGDPTVGASLGLTGLVVCHTNLLGKLAEALDNQLDDGKPSSGSVKAWKQTGLVTLGGTEVDISIAGAVAPDATYVDDGTTVYTVCKTAL